MGDKIRLRHILDAISEIETYIQNTDYNEFIKNSMMRFACIKQMEIIGEACNHISGSTKEKFSAIEWKQIIGMRNVFVHEYFGVDSKIIWEIIQVDIPELKVSIAKIIQSID